MDPDHDITIVVPRSRSGWGRAGLEAGKKSIQNHKFNIQDECKLCLSRVLRSLNIELWNVLSDFFAKLLAGAAPDPPRSHSWGLADFRRHRPQPPRARPRNQDDGSDVSSSTFHRAGSTLRTTPSSPEAPAWRGEKLGLTELIAHQRFVAPLRPPLAKGGRRRKASVGGWSEWLGPGRGDSLGPPPHRRSAPAPPSQGGDEFGLVRRNKR